MGFMDFEHLFKPLNGVRSPLVVGTSGGPDSLCLLHGLLQGSWDLVPVYYDHQIRKETSEEADLITEMLADWGLSTVVGRGDVPAAADEKGLSLEEAARKMRYQFLFKHAEEIRAGAVLVGHHADDQVETILMNLLRGTGLSGLTGMSKTTRPTPWSESIPLIRPLLPVWREAILRYCSSHGIRYLVDPSNSDPGFYRNRIRKELIPVLETYNAGVRSHLFQTAEILRADQEILKEAEESSWKAIQPEYGPGWVSIQRSGFLELPLGLQRRVIKRGFRELIPGSEQVSFQHLNTAVEVILSGDEGVSRNLVHQISVHLRGEKIYLAGTETPLPHHGDFPRVEPGSLLRLRPPGELVLEGGWILAVVEENLEESEPVIVDPDPFRAVMDSKAAGEELRVSGRREGERMRPLGMSSGSIKLSDLMINEKLPVYARDHWPVVRSGDRVIWVPGVRLAESVRVDESTRRVYVLTLARRPGP